MKYSMLGSSGLKVSRVCLGSMTWGFQNTQQDAFEQIEYALDKGINFIDTAELYAIPPTPDTYGKTETYIGNWLAQNSGRRKDIVLASKIAGAGLPWVRDGGDITGEAVIQAVDDSLARLQTDYIDLYQLHWPNRPFAHFGNHWPGQIKFSDIDTEAEEAQLLDILQGVAHCVKAGKIRHFGLSDDSTWGIKAYLELSKKYDLPRVVSIQNEFNLLHTKDWPYLIEHCVREDIAYLPWSPLACGALSGKYIDGARPEGSRWTFEQRNGLLRDTEQSNAAIKAYCELAKDHGISSVQLALAWCDQVDGVTSTIIGATKMDQLKHDIDAFSTVLSEDLQRDILAVMKKHPSPF